MKNFSNPDQKAALDKVQDAVDKYLRVMGEQGNGSIVTGWMLVGASTRHDTDGEPMYKTWTYLQPGGFSPHIVIGILSTQLDQWSVYFNEPDAEDQEDG